MNHALSRASEKKKFFGFISIWHKAGGKREELTIDCLKNTVLGCRRKGQLNSFIPAWPGDMGFAGIHRVRPPRFNGGIGNPINISLL